MSLFDKFLRKYEQKNNENAQGRIKIPPYNEKIDELVLDSNELITISNNGFIDTNSPLAIEKLKHNLKILIEKAKQEGKIEKFMIIRDDDFFPFNWMWTVSSKNTNLEKATPQLSQQLKFQYALEKANKNEIINGIRIPIATSEKNEILKNVNKETGFINMPVHFRSTKHFTINKPLGVTGNYNTVTPNRNFTIIDTIDNFLASGYGYSIAYHDAYLDVTHEGLSISHNAIILIEESKYQDIIKKTIILKELGKRKVIIYRGEEEIAINMILSELGVLPAQMGDKYIYYDQELSNILDKSIKDLAINNNLLYDKSHSGKNGHFTDYYDEKNLDYSNSLGEFVAFLKLKFPEEYITIQTISNENLAINFIDKVGTENLLSVIEEYNEITEKRLTINRIKYQEDRALITPEISDIFKRTISFIKKYYNQEEYNNYSLEMQAQIEENICHFYQDSTVREQLIAANNLWNIFKITVDSSNITDEFIYNQTSENKHYK